MTDTEIPKAEIEREAQNRVIRVIKKISRFIITLVI